MHLACVVTEMLTLGAPTIEVVDCGGYYLALEGSHRLPAAAMLGLAPVFVIRAPDDAIEVTHYAWFEETFFPEPTHTAGQVAVRLQWAPAPVYQFS